LINAYKVVKDNVERLIELLSEHQRNYHKNGSNYYYELRADAIKPSTTTKNEVETAARFITLNKTCFNGLYRVNKKGMFDGPMGKYKNHLICDSKNLRNVSLALNHSMANIIVSSYISLG
jgi:DNA adenine methylase